MDTSSTSADFLEKLKRALSRDGDFPANARVVSELREVISNPEATTNQVAEIILREPSLGTRVLHLVNSSFYRRTKPILTVSQAVVQIGMRPLAELCSGLILLQKFIPAARQGGPFAICLKRTITTSLLTSSLSSQLSGNEKEGKTKSKVKDEAGYLTGSFAELGTLLLAYYFPKLYESATKRSQTKSQPLAQSIQELVGLSPIQISIEVLKELKLPNTYCEVLEQSAALIDEHGEDEVDDIGEDTDPSLVFSLYAGLKLSSAITGDASGPSLDEVLAEIKQVVPMEGISLSDVLGSLVESFDDYCSSLELKLPKLPEELKNYRETAQEEEERPETIIHELTEEEQFSEFVEEIRVAVENREPSASVITTVMETFAWSLGFDRVLLMLLAPGKKQLMGRMLLGSMDGFNPKEFQRPVGTGTSSHAPDALAIKEARPIYRGDPLFDEGWPFVAIPVGYDKRSVGVIYADRTSGEDRELSSREQAAIGVLAELLDRSISLNS